MAVGMAQVTPGRQGQCRHCGNCCSQDCPAFRWFALRDIGAGEEILTGIDHGMVRSLCLAFASTENIGGCTPEARAGFPFHPSSRPGTCGLFWPGEGG